MKKDEKYLCKRCKKEIRVKSVTPELSQLGFCPQCHTKKTKSACQFDKNGTCYALVCYTSESCGARDEHGSPKYADLDEITKQNDMDT